MLLLLCTKCPYILSRLYHGHVITLHFCARTTYFNISLLFILRIFLAILECLFFQMNFRIIFQSFKEHPVGIFVRIAFNLWINLGGELASSPC